MGALGLSLAGLISGCVVPADLLPAKPCPCAAGFVCRTPENVCVRGDAGEVDSGPGLDGGRDAGGPDAGSDGLLARFDCESIGPTGLEDVSGNGRDARCDALGCPTQTPGPDGMACAFDGSGQRLRVTYDDGLRPDDGFSVLLSVRPEVEAQLSAIGVPFGDSIFNSWQVFFTRITDTFYVSFVSATTDAARPLNHSPVVAGEWIDVAIVYDGSTKLLYVDGVEVRRSPDEVIASDRHDVLIGADENAGSIVFPFNGAIDSIAIYGRPLDAAEVAAAHGP